MLQGTVASELIKQTFSDGSIAIEVEHPTGQFIVEMEVAGSKDINLFTVKRAALLRTARLLMRGEALVSYEAVTVNI